MTNNLLSFPVAVTAITEDHPATAISTSAGGVAAEAMIVKFPYSASRRILSRRPRNSKNGTPEERAAKAAAMCAPLGTIIDLPSQPATNRMRVAGAAIAGSSTDEPSMAAETSTTAKNARLRSARREAWRKADAATDFWDAYLRFTDQVARARAVGVQEAHRHPELDCKAQWKILDRYREALGKQLLTPAPDIATVNWKRHKLSEACIGVKKEHLKKSIADDVAFLEAHPTRNSRARPAVQS